MREVTMDRNAVVLEVEGPLARITLNRPDVLNVDVSFRVYQNVGA